LFVGGIAPGTDEPRLADILSRPAPCAFFKYKPERGIAFATYHTRRDAEKAKQELHMRTVDGKQLKIGWGRGWVETPGEQFNFTTGEATVTREALGLEPAPKKRRTDDYTSDHPPRNFR